MATKEKQSQQSNGADEAGWQDVGQTRSNMFWKVAEGAHIQGELLGRYARFKQEGHLYQLRLTTPVEVVQDKKTIMAKVGDVVNVDEKATLRSLAPLCDGYRREIRITCTGKVAVKKGEAWTFKVQNRVLGALPDGQRIPNAANPQMSEEALPF